MDTNKRKGRVECDYRYRYTLPVDLYEKSLFDLVTDNSPCDQIQPTPRAAILGNIKKHNVERIDNRNNIQSPRPDGRMVTT